eukprot:5027054-Pleurochrysis_carterae.AAC.1
MAFVLPSPATYLPRRPVFIAGYASFTRLLPSHLRVASIPPRLARPGGRWLDDREDEVRHGRRGRRAGRRARRRR